jgi:3-polyprenyl-4-hydroxybenzoate decarboxylase
MEAVCSSEMLDLPTSTYDIITQKTNVNRMLLVSSIHDTHRFSWHKIMSLRNPSNFSLIVVLTNVMEQRHHLEADSHKAGQEILIIYRT